MKTVPLRWLASLWTVSALITLTLLVYRHERLSIHRPVALAIVAGILIAGWFRFEFADAAEPRRRVMRDLAENIGLFAALALIGTVATYPIAAASTGFVDPALAHFDGLLGFDWLAWYRVVAAAPWLQIAGRVVYQNIFLSPAILLVHYAVTGRQDRARCFLLAVWIALILTLMLFPYFAAVGPLAYLWRGPIPYMPTSALFQLQLIPELRSHAVETIDAAALRGLVEAPSFHTVSAVIYLAYGWREARLRWPLAALNVAMLLATPVEGTHYLTDMILGALVAVAALATVPMLVRLAGEGGRFGQAGATGRGVVDALSMAVAPAEAGAHPESPMSSDPVERPETMTSYPA